MEFNRIDECFTSMYWQLIESQDFRLVPGNPLHYTGI